ncbi:hypothetical protein ACTNEN_12275 [Oribacterium sp. HCP28S3_H8]|uniref:hypothetical protein n=1 Tax=Oribacterium sp. HCP28S3_H8 TaxID=3438945 RepID=UPI003F8C3C36
MSYCGVYSSSTPDTREIIRRPGAPGSMSKLCFSSRDLPGLPPLRDPVSPGLWLDRSTIIPVRFIATGGSYPAG